MNLIVQNLPKLSEEEIFLSNQLKNHLIELISQRDEKYIAFSEYMNEVLFSNLGYYKNGTEKFGRKGDFITAPEISPIFAKLIAPSLEKAFACLGARVMVEFGSGSGALMLSLLQCFQAQNHPIEQYYLLDISADLKVRQKELLKKNAPELLDSVIWLDSFNTSDKNSLPKKAVVIANEVLDTFLVDCFIQKQSIAKGQWFNLKSSMQKAVAIDSNRDFCFQEKPLTKGQKIKLEAINEYFKHSGKGDFHYFKDGYSSELPANYSPWLKAIKDQFESVVCFLFDYGLSNHQYYSPEKSQGTLRCFYRHLLHTDPFYFPGISDLTCDVNFSKLLSDARKNDFHCLHYTTQGQFLLNGNFEAILSEAKGIEEQTQLTSDFKKMVLPSEMGEVFKVMVLAFNQDANKPNLTSEHFDFVSRDLTHHL